MSTQRPRPIDRPAVAIIITAAVTVAVLLALYVAHVLAPRPVSGDDTSAGPVSVIAAAYPCRPGPGGTVCTPRPKPHKFVICGTYWAFHRKAAAVVTHRYLPRVPCHTTTVTRGHGVV